MPASASVDLWSLPQHSCMEDLHSHTHSETSLSVWVIFPPRHPSDGCFLCHLGKSIVFSYGVRQESRRYYADQANIYNTLTLKGVCPHECGCAASNQALRVKLGFLEKEESI